VVEVVLVVEGWVVVVGIDNYRAYCGSLEL
jgi:hypothetical protein